VTDFWQLRAGVPARSIHKYFIYTPVLDNCYMHCSTFGAPNRCIPALQELKTGNEKVQFLATPFMKLMTQNG